MTVCSDAGRKIVAAEGMGSLFKGAGANSGSPSSSRPCRTPPLTARVPARSPPWCRRCWCPLDVRQAPGACLRQGLLGRLGLNIPSSDHTLHAFSPFLYTLLCPSSQTWPIGSAIHQESFLLSVAKVLPSRVCFSVSARPPCAISEECFTLQCSEFHGYNAAPLAQACTADDHLILASLFAAPCSCCLASLLKCSRCSTTACALASCPWPRTARRPAALSPLRPFPRRDRLVGTRL